MKNHGKENWSSWRNRILTAAAIVALAVSVFVGVLTAPVLAQSAASQSPSTQSLEAMEAAGLKMSFDVASVKPNKSGGRGYSNVPLRPAVISPPNGGLFSATNLPLIVYITFAYNLTSDQFLRLQPQLPKWATADGFDIQARAEGIRSREQMQLMMQSLLADRFKLVIHTETKQGPVYALVLAKPGKTGPQLKPDAEPCSTEPASPTPGPPPPTSAAAEFPTVCGFSIMRPSAPGRVRAGGRSVSLGLLAIYLTGPFTGVDRPVVDGTGLSGNIDFSIEFTPELNGPPPPNFQPDATGPTFLQALQEQLGLKLEPQTGPVSALVVDHIEEPSPN